MAVSMFMKCTGIKGECGDDAHPGWMEIDSWSASYEQKGTPKKGGKEGEIDRASHKLFEVEKNLCIGSMDLKKACWSGKQLDEVIIECYRAAGSQTLADCYLKIEMKNVMINDYDLKSKSEGKLPQEILKLSYTEIKFTYKRLTKHKGQLTDTAVAGHELANNVIT